jgi:hypothetical protein
MNGNVDPSLKLENFTYSLWLAASGSKLRAPITPLREAGLKSDVPTKSTNWACY